MLTSSELATQYGPPTRRFSAFGINFECRPISAGAPDKSVGIMYRRTGDVLRQAGVGFVKDGCWRNASGKRLDGDDLYWTVMVNRGE